MEKYINDIEVTAATFAWDGCHKIYLCENDEDIERMKHNGYERGDFYPIEDLPEIWNESCGLRFISRAGDLTDIVPQCEDAHFEGFEKVIAKRALFIDGERYGYSPDQVYGTYTIRQLIQHLENMGHQIGFDSPVFLRNDNGYTYGGIRDESIEQGAFNDDDVWFGDDKVWEAERDGVMFIS